MWQLKLKKIISNQHFSTPIPPHPVFKTQLRAFGKTRTLRNVEEVAELFNTQSPPIQEDSWVSYRRVIVLPPIDHRPMSISAIPNIKSYSCFRPYNFNRLALKRLPCHCAGCLVMNKKCKLQHMAGWFDDEVIGSYYVQFLLKHSKKEEQYR